MPRFKDLKSLGKLAEEASPAIKAVEEAADAAKALPMDEASRLARAKEMGFDTEKTYYHGTSSDGDFHEFKEPRKDNSNRFGAGTYFAENPEVANKYAGYMSDEYKYNDPNGKIIPVHLKTNIIEHGPYEVESELAAKLGFKNKEEFETAVKEMSPGQLPWDDKIAEFLKSKGYGGRKIGGQTVIFEPKDIRSKFAEFDPAKKDSSKLAAGLAGAAIGGGAMLAAEDSEAAIYSQGKKLTGKTATEAMESLLSRAKKGENLYHGTTKQVAEKVGKGESLYPSKGKIVEDAYGEYLNPDEYPGAVEDALFFAEKPGYIGGHKGWKNYETKSDPEFIKKHGGLTVTSKSDDFHFNDNKNGTSDPEYKSLVSRENTYPFDNEATPINVEGGDIFTTDSVKPDYALTGKELLEYLTKGYAEEFPGLVKKSAKKAAGLGGAAIGAGLLSGSPAQASDKYDSPQKIDLDAGAGTNPVSETFADYPESKFISDHFPSADEASEYVKNDWREYAKNAEELPGVLTAGLSEGTPTPKAPGRALLDSAMSIGGLIPPTNLPAYKTQDGETHGIDPFLVEGAAKLGMAGVKVAPKILGNEIGSIGKDVSKAIPPTTGIKINNKRMPTPEQIEWLSAQSPGTLKKIIQSKTEGVDHLKSAAEEILFSKGIE